MTKKSVLIVTIVFLTFSLIVSGLLYFYYQQLLLPVSNSSNSRSFVSFSVNLSEPASSVANRLKQLYLIKSADATIIFLKLSNLENQFKPGKYQLSSSNSTQQIITILTQGPKDIKITFPEGWRREQIADRLASSLTDFSRSEFLLKSATLEGQLFPDTYLFSPTASPADILKKFSTNFTQKSNLILPDQQHLLILASMVEREAKNDSDRRIIAGILFNRLEIGMPLQVDASVQYARDSARPTCRQAGTICDYWSPIYDTKFISPYNTYLHSGLPPGPIANPGLASIKAVLNPQNSNYLFYLTDSLGVTHYAQSLEEHNRNVDKYLKI